MKNQTLFLHFIITFLLFNSSYSFTFGQKVRTARFFKQQFNVYNYQDQNLTIKAILKNTKNDSTDIIIRSFFDGKSNRNLGYVTPKLKKISLEDNWIQYEGIIPIPKNTQVLDFAILTSKFSKTINIASISFTDSEGEKLKEFESTYFDFDKSKRKFEIMNYSSKEDSILKFHQKNTLALTIEKSTFYGNNLDIGKYIKINGVDFYYEIYGEGEPLLLLHGNNESINSFDNQIDSLKFKYKVIAIDSRCQGRSSCNDTELSYDLMATDMNAFLEELKIDKVNILGWSDGGNTGISMALKYPERVKSLITMGANLFPNTEALEPEFWKKFKHESRMSQLMAVVDKSMKQYVKVNRMCFKYPNIQPQELSKITIPTLILAGEKDVIRKEHSELIAKNIKNSKLYFFMNASHYVPKEKPKEFNQIVLDFLDKANPINPSKQ
jgi:pimeloyl-ACP methyl ester carboxylesterase